MIKQEKVNQTFVMRYNPTKLCEILQDFNETEGR